MSHFDEDGALSRSPTPERRRDTRCITQTHVQRPSQPYPTCFDADEAWSRSPSPKRRRGVISSLHTQVETDKHSNPFARWLSEQTAQQKSALQTVYEIGGRVSEIRTEDAARQSLQELVVGSGTKACEIIRRRCLDQLSRPPPFPFSTWLEERSANGAKAKRVCRALNYSFQHGSRMSDKEQWDHLWRLAKKDNAWDIIAGVSKNAGANQLSFLPARECISMVQGVQEVARMIERSKSILVLTGAGISASCGIPTYRDDVGRYQQIADEFGLSCPQVISDINFFKRDPRPWFKKVQAIVPSELNPRKPSLTHRFIASLEARGKLLHQFTQNIDMLEVKAGVSKLTFCHGSFATATCTKCERSVVGPGLVNESVAAGSIPFCQAKRCSGGVYKPNVVMFNEPMPKGIEQEIQQCVPRADLLLVIGTSLSVAPCAFLPSLVGSCGPFPRILVNLERVGRDTDFEGFLQGQCDEIFSEVLNCLQWTLGGRE